MNSFDQTYQPGRVYRLSFGHGDPGEHGRPFARQDVVVTDEEKDHLVGFKAWVNEGGSLHDQEEGHDPEAPNVKIKDRVVTVRKEAVVMRRDFGPVEDVNIPEDKTGEYADDDQELIADGGLSESDLREAAVDFFDEDDVVSVDYSPERDSGMVVVETEVGVDFEEAAFEDVLTEHGFAITGGIPAPGMTQVNVESIDGNPDPEVATDGGVDVASTDGTEYKRDIRADVADVVGMNRYPNTEYEPPETGDRRFNLEQLGLVLRYLDVSPPRRNKVSHRPGKKKGSTYDYTRAVAAATERVVGKRVDVVSPGKSWSGFTKEDLRTIRDAVRSYDPIGLPDEDDVADRLFETSDMSRERAESEAERLLRHRRKGHDDITVGFTVDDVRVKVRRTAKVDAGVEDV